MLISVIVPVYNTRQYLSACLDSILNQTYKNIEVVLVDDGSTDGSLEICMDYAKTDSRIIVVQQEHGGLVEARKSGVKTSKGNTVYLWTATIGLRRICWKQFLH